MMASIIIVARVLNDNPNNHTNKLRDKGIYRLILSCENAQS